MFTIDSGSGTEMVECDSGNEVQDHFLEFVVATS
jgi:hypothetical protein